MPGKPYIGADRRTRIQADWTAGGATLRRDFLIDTGASISAVDDTSAVGLTFKGAIGVQSVTGTTQVLQFSGGQLAFDVEDSATGNTVTVVDSGDVLLLNQCLIGNEVLQRQKLSLYANFGTTPPDVRLVR